MSTASNVSPKTIWHLPNLFQETLLGTYWVQTVESLQANQQVLMTRESIRITHLVVVHRHDSHTWRESKEDLNMSAGEI